MGVEEYSWEANPRHRWRFQNQETDEEIWGGSSHYKYRMHNPKIGRFFAMDPLASKYPNLTPYSFSGNRVIDAIEHQGLEALQLGIGYEASIFFWGVGEEWGVIITEHDIYEYHSSIDDVVVSAGGGAGVSLTETFWPTVTDPETQLKGKGTMTGASVSVTPLWSVGAGVATSTDNEGTTHVGEYAQVSFGLGLKYGASHIITNTDKIEAFNDLTNKRRVLLNLIDRFRDETMWASKNYDKANYFIIHLENDRRKLQNTLDNYQEQYAGTNEYDQNKVNELQNQINTLSGSIESYKNSAKVYKSKKEAANKVWGNLLNQLKKTYEEE